MTQPNIKIIFFDVYGVLVGVSDYREDVAKYLGLPIDQVKEANHRAINSHSLPSWTAVDSRQKEIEFSKAAATALLKELSIEPKPELVQDICSMWFSRQHYAIDGVMETLEYLKTKYQLGIISNAAPSLRTEVLPQVGLLPYFDPIVISGEIGVRKPDPDIYLEALRQAAVEPEEAAFIDDHESFLDVPSQLGFGQVILLDGQEEGSEFQTISSISELKKLL